MEQSFETSPSTPVDKKLNGLFPPVITVISIITILGNLLVIVTLYEKPRREQGIFSYYLMMNLAIADLMVGLIGEPLWISAMLMSDTPSECHRYDVTARTVMVLAVCASRCTVFFLTLERYVALEMPLRREKLFSGMALKLYILLIWLYASGFTLLSIFDHHKKTFLPVYLSLSQFELVVILVLYVRTFMIIRKFNKALLANGVRESLIQPGHTYRLARKRECSVVKDIFFLVGAYALCFEPLFVTYIIAVFGENVTITNNMKELLLVFCTLRFALDPILYTFVIPGYRWQVKRMVYNLARACMDRSH